VKKLNRGKKNENIKKGERALKNASFWAINSNRKLICRGKKLNLKSGGDKKKLS